MILYLRIALVYLLIVIFSHAPIPWLHQHEGMTAAQLLNHFQQYHQNCPASSVPVGWHCHVTELATSDDRMEAAALAISGAETRLRTWLDSLSHPYGFRGLTRLFDTSSTVASTAALVETQAGLPQAHLFKLYESLLI